MDPNIHDTELRAADEQASAWVLKLAAAPGGKLNPPDADAFERWLAADPAHPAALLRMREVWHALDELPSEAVHAWLASARAANPPAPAAAPAVAIAMPARRIFFTRAVGTAGLVGVGGAMVASTAWWLLSQQRAQPLYTQTWRTQRGQRLPVTLPDGSRVELDTATELRVAHYRDRREAVLASGQAWFGVAPDAQRPFHVDAAGIRASVLGTRFQVRLIEGAASVQVEEGRVRVGPRPAAEADGADDHGASAIVLTGGQMVQADAQGGLRAVVAVVSSAIAPWRTGRLTFDDQPLAEILAEFDRYVDLHLIVRDPAVRAMRITGDFEIAKAGSFARALPEVLPVRLVQRGEVSEILAR